MAKILSMFLKILVTLPAVAFLLFLTISNRSQSLTLTWSPFHHAAPFALPLVLLGAIVVGFIWGCLILWSNTLEMRAELRARKKKILTLEQQLNIHRADLERLSAQKTKIQISAAATLSPSVTPRIATPEIV